MHFPVCRSFPKFCSQLNPPALRLHKDLEPGSILVPFNRTLPTRPSIADDPPDLKRAYRDLLTLRLEVISAENRGGDRPDAASPELNAEMALMSGKTHLLGDDAE